MKYSLFVLSLLMISFLLPSLCSGYAAIECPGGQTPVYQHEPLEGWVCREGGPSVIYPEGESVARYYE